MSSMNKAILLGNLGQKPEIRRTNDGRPIANLSLATSEVWRDKNTGEKREKTEWHRIVCFNEGLCKIIEEWLDKGDKIMVVGQLQTRSWEDKEGVKKYSTEIVLQAFNGELKIIACKAWDKNRGSRDEGAGAKQSTPPPERRQSTAGRRDELDDDIPF